MDCVVIAGGVPQEEDLLYEYTQGKPKALLDMNGRPMIERVVNGLQSARQVEDVVLVGLDDDLGLEFQRPVTYLPGRSNLVSNAIAGIEWIREQKPETKAVIASSADVPLITGPIIDDFIDRCRPFDHGIYYNFVQKETLEARFPHSTRTYTWLKGIQVAGGDISMVQVALLDVNRELWDALADARKHAWQLARAVGFWTLFKLLTRQLSLSDIEKLGGRLTGHPMKVLLNPHPEIAMDADKPHQVDMLRRELARREEAAP